MLVDERYRFALDGDGDDAHVAPLQRFAESLGVHWAGTSDQKPSAQLARTGQLAANIEALEHGLDQGLEQAMGRAASKTRQLSSAVRDLLNQGTVRDGECAASVLVRGMQPRGAGVRHTLC